MLMLTDGGAMMGGPEAIEFFERLDDVIDMEIKDEEFCRDFTRALNRCRYSVARDIPMEPKLNKGRRGKKYENYTCARCGYIIRTEYTYCPKCGQMLTRHYLGRRATKEEMSEYVSKAMQESMEMMEQEVQNEQPMR